jgi:hypothetical protein
LILGCFWKLFLLKYYVLSNSFHWAFLCSRQTSQHKLSEREIAQAWAQITVKLWRKNLSRLKVGQHSSDELFRSFQFKVISGAGGNVDRIEFAFRYYGKFLDMEIGRSALDHDP